MKKITQLTLSFPHGASVSECDNIAQRVQKIVGAGVSEGGMATTNKYGMYVDEVTFSEDSMHYVFGHARDEKCIKCGSTEFAVARDMIGTRHCSCGFTWEPVK